MGGPTHFPVSKSMTSMAVPSASCVVGVLFVIVVCYFWSYSGQEISYLLIGTLRRLASHQLDRWIGRQVWDALDCLAHRSTFNIQVFKLSQIMDQTLKVSMRIKTSCFLYFLWESKLVIAIVKTRYFLTNLFIQSCFLAMELSCFPLFCFYVFAEIYVGGLQEIR